MYKSINFYSLVFSVLLPVHSNSSWYFIDC